MGMKQFNCQTLTSCSLLRSPQTKVKQMFLHKIIILLLTIRLRITTTKDELFKCRKLQRAQSQLLLHPKTTPHNLNKAHRLPLPPPSISSSPFSGVDLSLRPPLIMKLQTAFSLFVLLSVSIPSSSARFFPNISSIPPDYIPNATQSAWNNFRQLAGCHVGEKLDGLSKLKQYFNHFGYIPSSVSNFTDDFDDLLESAIKTYQRNFNLNVTGELDQQTLDQLVRPRCGNADIVNGTTAMNSGKWTESPTFHTVGHYAFFPGNPKWPEGQRDLTYAFLPGNGLTAEDKSVFARAFDRWAAVIPMTFTETNSYFLSDIKIGFYSGDHSDGEPFDGVLGTLAHAFSPPSGRLHLDADETWVVTGDISTATVPTAVDLESVIVHEIGHLLGLGHSSVEEAIMYPTISSRVKKVELAADDVEGIQALYGRNPNYNGSATETTSVQERESSGSGSRLRSGFISLVAVGLAFLSFHCRC